jgi:hypothetical protein
LYIFVSKIITNDRMDESQMPPESIAASAILADDTPPIEVQTCFMEGIPYIHKIPELGQTE